MKFRILSREAVETYHEDENHIVISVRDPGSVPAILLPLKSRVNTLYIEFNDFIENYDNMPDEKSKYLFNEEYAYLIWDYVLDHMENSDISMIVVNCEYGISRSSAIGASLAKVLNGENKDFFRKYCPNHLVYKTMLKVAERRGL